MKMRCNKKTFELFISTILRKDKKGIELEMLGWWIIALVVLVLLIMAILILKSKGISAIDYIKNLFRFKG